MCLCGSEACHCWDPPILVLKGACVCAGFEECVFLCGVLEDSARRGCVPLRSEGCWSLLALECVSGSLSAPMLGLRTVSPRAPF